MSEQNVELHRRVLEAFNAWDIEAFLALNDPSIEFHSLTTTHGGPVRHGHDGLRRWLQDLEEVWEELRTEPEAFFDLGDHTIMLGVTHGRGRQSGAEVAQPFTQVIRWREGLAVYVKQYADRTEAFRDLGASEDALEPIAP